MDFAPVLQSLEERTIANKFGGVVRIDVDGVPVVREAYGLASRTWLVPNELGTRFDTASVTKLFTAVAVLQQVEAGAFSLDTGVVDFLGLSDTTISAGVTPYQLLTHTSGIGDDADEEAGEEYEQLFVQRPNYSVRATVDLLPQFVQREPNFPPGEGCRYCNCSYVLLGLMVERATGWSYRDYVVDRVFRPAGMSHSGFFAMDRVESNVAEGLEALIDASGEIMAWRRNIYSYPPIGSPDGGAHVTADDLVAFHRSLLAGDLVSPENTRAMFRPHQDYRANGLGMHRTGFGWEFQVDLQGRVSSYWKEGINVGASAIIKHYPPQGVTACLLSNLQEGVWEPLKRLDALLNASGHGP